MARGKDGLYQRNGIFCFRYKDHDVWKEKSTGERDRTKARAFKKDFDKKLEAGELPTETAKQTVERACTRWVEQHARGVGRKGGLKSPKAQKNEQSYLRTLVKHLGGRKLKSVTLDDLQQYQAERQGKVKGRPINCELGILVSVLRKANLWHGELEREYHRLSEGEEKVGSALTDDQSRLLESVAASKDAWTVAHLAFLLAVNSGMRGAEIKRLQLRHVDFNNKRLSVEDSKTAKSNRMVELNSTALSAVAKLWMRAQSLGAKEPGHYLLPADLSRHTKQADPLKNQTGFDPTRHQETWDTAWRNLRAAAVESIRTKAKEQNRELTFKELADTEVLGKIGFHSMRRTFITSMAERGVPVSVTKEIVGHTSEKMTEHYERISRDAQRRAVELLNSPQPANQQPQEKPATEKRVYLA
ncbi:MAG TPA: site-specific integrase [Terriglobia bacterium]|nr:site-specific integrase [Terriglobia bacterium]